jgi:6-phosphofructokinase 1
MAKTSTKVFVLEVMGRHAGWIAAAGGLAADEKNDIPILILFPEIEFDQNAFTTKVKEKVEAYGYCSIVVSEGARWPGGKFLAEQGTNDAFGHAQLGGAAPVIADMIKDTLGYKYHWAVADYLQRAARHIASETDVNQAYALGKAAVDMAIAGENAVMPIIHRMSDEPYIWEIRKAKLEDVANVEKMMPKEFITNDGFGITEACRRYLSPLIEGEDYPPYNKGLPVYVTLKNNAVKKILNTEFIL